MSVDEDKNIGQQFGTYRLVRRLGSGGFASVYLGQHVLMATQQVAVKTLHLFDVNTQNFQQEAETTAALVHPHIVRLFDFDLHEGTPFLVMDYAPHGSLRNRHLRGTAVPLATAKGSPMENNSESTPIAGRSDISLSGWGKGLWSPLTFGLVSCSGVGAFLFTATYLLEGIMRPGYDAWQQPISALSLGPGGWVQQVNFVVFGVLTLLSAFGWYRLLTPGRTSIVFPLLQSLAGLGLIVAGFFSLDPFPGYPPGVVLTAPTVHGTIHTICAIAIILFFADGCMVLARRFALEPRWRGWAVYSILTGVLILVFFILFLIYSPGPASGVVERLSTLSHALWSCLLLVTLLFQKRSHL